MEELVYEIRENKSGLWDLFLTDNVSTEILVATIYEENHVSVLLNGLKSYVKNMKLNAKESIDSF